MIFCMFFKRIILFLSICKTVHLQSATQNDATTKHTIPCEEGWIYFGQKCYKAVMDHVTWAEASAQCINMGGHLLSIHSKEEQNFVTGFILSEMKATSWFGMHDTANEGKFVWTDGSNVDYTIWGPGQPDGRNLKGEKEDCGEIFYKPFLANTGDWNDAVCTRQNPYICKKERNEALSSPDPFFCSPEKGGGWKLIGACYNFVNQEKSWHDAEQYCRNTYNGHLVTISDWAIDWFINYILKDFKGPIWIGIKLRNQLQQKWASGWHVAYSFLRNEDPSQFTEEICVLRVLQNTWLEMPCDQDYSFVCESSKDNPIKLKNPLKGWECPRVSKDWRDLDGEFCYHFEKINKLTWFQATKECNRRGGTLASVHSQEENDVLHPFVEDTRRHLLIGLNSLLSGGTEYTWSDGSPSNFTNWDSRKPSREKQQCVEIFTNNMEWNDLGCKAPRSFICSARKVPPNEGSAESPDESRDGVSTNVMIAEEFISKSYCLCFPM